MATLEAKYDMIMIVAHKRSKVHMCPVVAKVGREYSTAAFLLLPSIMNKSRHDEVSTWAKQLKKAIEDAEAGVPSGLVPEVARSISSMRVFTVVGHLTARLVRHEEGVVEQGLTADEGFVLYPKPRSLKAVQQSQEVKDYWAEFWEKDFPRGY